MNLFIPLVLSMFLAAGVFAQNGSVTATPPPKQDDTNIEINRKPLADFADDLAKQWESKQIDLNQNFTVVLNGVLTKDGKFDGGRSKFDVTGQKGDPKMIAVGKRALEAVGDSGFLIYLVSLGVDSVNITLFQDNDQFGAVATSPQKSAERARVIASGTEKERMRPDQKKPIIALRSVPIRLFPCPSAANFLVPEFINFLKQTDDSFVIKLWRHFGNYERTFTGWHIEFADPRTRADI